MSDFKSILGYIQPCVNKKKFKLFMHSSACCPVTSLLHKKKTPLAVALQERVYGIIPGVASLQVNFVYQKYEQHNNLVL